MMAWAAVDPSRPFLRARSSARRALLDAARRITEREGIEAVSLGSVSDEAGFARATTYANFCSRDELLQAVVADDLSALLQAMRREIGLPEPPSHPLPPTRIVRVEFQRVRDELDGDSYAGADGSESGCADSGTLSTDVLPLNLFRLPSNDQFEMAPAEPEPSVPPEEQPSNLPEASPVSEASESDRAGPAIDEECVQGAIDPASVARDEPAVGSLASSADDSGLSQRIDAFEKRHEQIVLEMMSEIRAIARKLNDFETFDRPAIPAREPPATEAPTPSATESASPCIAQAPLGTVPEPAPSAEVGEADIGWTIRFATDSVSRVRRSPVAAARGLPVQMVVAEPQRTGARTWRIAIALAAGVVLLAATALALRSHSANFRPVAPRSGSPAVSHVAARHASMKHISRAEGPVDRLTAQAVSGEPDSELTIGLKYLNGDGATKNEAVGAGWIARSALKGNTLAQYWLATLYEHGRGVAVDPVQAFAWYEKAALGGNRKAMHNLAVAYAQGSGVAKDMSEAARWFSRAAALGYVDSAFNLAVLYERGDGVPQSLIDAYKWYAIAAAQGDAESKLRMSAIESELSPDAVSAAEKAAAAFKAADAPVAH